MSCGTFCTEKARFRQFRTFELYPPKAIFKIDIELFGADICRPHKKTLMLITFLVQKEKRWAYIHIVHKSMYSTDLLYYSFCW